MGHEPLLSDGLEAAKLTADRLLITGARVVHSSGVRVADVLVDGGQIAAVGENLLGTEIAANALVVDARGKHLLPGAIDMHVHFRDPLPQNPAEDLRSGSLAAAAGGVIGFADMPNTDPAVTSVAVLESKLALAAEKSVVDYSFFVAIPAHGDMADLAGIDTRTIPGLKIFMGGTTRAEALSDAQLEAGFALAAKLGVPAVVHAEDDAIIAANYERFRGELADAAVHARIRDAACCLAATKKAVALAKKHGVHLHIAHLSTAAEAEFIAEIQAAGEMRVTAEVTLHHLFFAVDDYARLGHFLKCNPSVKTAADRAALWKALRAGTISFVATDHAPHPKAAKERPYDAAPSGVPGVEFVLPALLNEVNAGRVSLPEVALWTAEAPAKMYGIAGKGAIAVGNDADIVIVDMERTREVTSVRSGCGHSPWLGATLQGWPVLTLLRGTPVFADVGAVPIRPAKPLRFRQ